MTSFPPPFDIGFTWEPKNFDEYNRRWSILADIYLNFFGINFGLSFGVRAEDISESNFWVRDIPNGSVRPLVTLEKVEGANKPRELGVQGRENRYRLKVYWPEENTDTTQVPADIELDCLNEDLVHFLNERRVPFYDFSKALEAEVNLAVRKAERDFLIYYVSDSRPSEPVDGEKNRLTINLRANI